VPEKGRPDDWTSLPRPPGPELLESGSAPDTADEDPTESERRHQPELSRAKPMEKKPPVENEFEIDVERDEDDDVAARNRRMTRMVQGVARQISLDPNDGMEL
jgi:type IV secretion system protein VirD4